MKKLFTFMSALLLWQTMAVAQNYLHISTGDSTKKVRIAELDSVTVRDKLFYGYDWEYVAMGTYDFAQVFGGVTTRPVYKQQLENSGTLWQFKVENWLKNNYPLFIDYDASTGRCHVKPQPTGYVHATYGMIMVADGATYTGNEDEYVSTYNTETGTFELFMVYYVNEGTFGYGYETLQLDLQASASARAQERRSESLDIQGKRPVQTLRRSESLQTSPIVRQVPAMHSAVDVKDVKNAPQQLMQCPVDQIVK